MTGSRVMIAILAVAILVGGFSAGRLIGQLLAADGARTQPTPTASAVGAAVPDQDQPGRDISGLPRFPGSVRTAYARQATDVVTVTTAAYAVRASRNDVRTFYLQVFTDAGWDVADLGFSLGTWTFVVERPSRQATVEITGRGETVLILLAVSRTLPAPTPEPTPEPTQRPTPAPPPPPPPPPSDDGDDGDDDDDDTDDDASDDDD